MISNTDRSDNPGTHWWGLLNLNPKKCNFFLWFFWCRRTKTFYYSKARKKFFKKYYLAWKYWNWLIIYYLNSTKYKLNLHDLHTKDFMKRKRKLSETTRDLFHYINKFGKFIMSEIMLNYIFWKINNKLLKVTFVEYSNCI